MFRQQSRTITPPIFADLLLDLAGRIVRVDVECPGWLEDTKPLYPHCTRVGLVHRRGGQRVWLITNGDMPRYFSQVNGQISDKGHKLYRTACITDDTTSVWLHDNGTVEIGPEPEVIHG